MMAAGCGRKSKMAGSVVVAGEVSKSSFLKKRSKKLLFVSRRAGRTSAAPKIQEFFGSFFQKRTCFLAFGKRKQPHQMC
jgi:hypothetical protein